MNLDKWAILLRGITPDGVDCHTVAPEYGNGYAVELETGIFLYAFTRRLHPRIVAETGTHWGFSGACIALALQDASIDYPHQSAGLFSVDWLDYDQKPEVLWKQLGVNSLIKHVIADSRMVSPVPNGIEFLWLDADHRPAWFTAEFEHFFPYLSGKGAWIGFHDTRLDKGVNDGVQAIFSGPLISTRYTQKSHIKMRNFRGFDLIQLLP